MNIGIGGAIFLWVLMLWPLIVGITYSIAQKPSVSNVPALTFSNIVIGYAAMFGAAMLNDLIERKVGNFELLVIVLLLLTPLLTTHLITRFAIANSKSNIGRQR